VVLGGKLGRHPRLAHELGFYSLPQALEILGNVLTVLIEQRRPGLRLGELIEKIGREEFDRRVRP
jgi:Nitrite and sulphite reductase 4Fe-4S domain.